MVTDTKNDEQPCFRIENKVLKGKVVPCVLPYNSLGKLLLDTLRNNPHLVGQVDGITGDEDTFADILDRSIKCALWLRKQGIGKGDIVAVSTHNHLNSIIPCIATLYVGATFNPWDHEMNTQTARYFITFSQPKAIFANEQSAPIALDAAKIEMFHTKIVTFGDHPGTIPFDDVLRGHNESAVADFQCEAIDDREQTAVILYTSGTTGSPKGTQLSHRSLLNVMDLKDVMDIKDMTGLWFSALYWITGTLFSLKGIYKKMKRIIAPSFDQKLTCELVEKYKISMMMLSTSMANRLVRYSHFHDYDLSSMEFLLVGGATLNKQSEDLLKKSFPDTFVVQAFGMTELGGLAAAQLKDSTSGSCGVVSTNCELKVIDPETGQILGPNQNGELCVKSAAIMTGYYKNPEATKHTIDSEGWLHTGDLAYYNEKGEVFIVDRLKEMIKYRGHQVAPNEIETLLQSHPAVLEAAVVGIPHSLDNEHPIAFVSKLPNKEVSAEELIKMVASNLMDHCKLRGGVKFLPTLPHTASGKISRKDLKALAKALAIY